MRLTARRAFGAAGSEQFHIIADYDARGLNDCMLARALAKSAELTPAVGCRNTAHELVSQI